MARTRPRHHRFFPQADRTDKLDRIREDYEKEFLRIRSRCQREVDRISQEKMRGERELLLQIEMNEREIRHLRSWNDKLAMSAAPGAGVSAPPNAPPPAQGNVAAGPAIPNRGPQQQTGVQFAGGGQAGGQHQQSAGGSATSSAAGNVNPSLFYPEQPEGGAPSSGQKFFLAPAQYPPPYQRPDGRDAPVGVHHGRLPDTHNAHHITVESLRQEEMPYEFNASYHLQTQKREKIDVNAAKRDLGIIKTKLASLIEREVRKEEAAAEKLKLRN